MPPEYMMSLLAADQGFFVLFPSPTITSQNIGEKAPFNQPIIAKTFCLPVIS
jgi:hypothetical protein